MAVPGRDPAGIQDPEELPTRYHASLESHEWGRGLEPPRRTRGRASPSTLRRRLSDKVARGQEAWIVSPIVE
jgi:hypothetical protein